MEMNQVTLSTQAQLQSVTSRLEDISLTPDLFFQVSDGMFTAHLTPDTILTLSTSTGQSKGSYDNIPPSKPFPIPYMDDFESNTIMMVVQNTLLGICVDRL